MSVYPNSNGLAAARQILTLVPNAKIIFVSQESSPDIAREALAIGAAGYLVKTDANQLLVAVDTVLDGRQFVSAALLKKLEAVTRGQAASDCAAPFRSDHNCLVGMLNREAPQSKQTETVGNTRMPGLLS